MEGKTPLELVREMAGGFSLTQILYSAVKLGIPDQLAKGPKQDLELARDINAHPKALSRFLRMMVVVNLLVQEEDPSFFRLSPLGELLRSDHPDRMYNRILYIGEVNYPAAQGMIHSIKTSEPAFEHVFGTSFFDYFGQNPEIGSIFNEQMSRAINDRIRGILAAYNFEDKINVVDVGGGNGALIDAILKENPHAIGTIFDLPLVVAEASRAASLNKDENRRQTIAGDFFHDEIPSGGDIYVLSNIIHDWDDERALQILRNCCAAMGKNSKLLLIEEILPENVLDAPVTVANDLSMLLLTGGRERTLAEYRDLLNDAGIVLTKLIPFEATRIYSKRKPNWAIIEGKLIP
ncbi:MAG: methyltransferase [Desulfuromonadaceae bacterium]|nr:methyltransferase [Desulfuromonadaceae bacterium]